MFHNTSIPDHFSIEDMLNLLPLGSCVINDELIVYAWNQTLEDWTGIKRSDAVGMNLGDRFPNLRTGRYYERLVQVFKLGAPAVYSSALHKHFIPIPICKDSGKQFMIQQTQVRALPGNASLALVTIQDVTEQHQYMYQLNKERINLVEAQRSSEDRLHESIEMRSSLLNMMEDAEANRKKLEEFDLENRKMIDTLRDSEARTRSIVDTAADGIISISEKGIIESFNKAAEQLFGYTAEHVIGQNVKMLMHAPDRQQHDQYLTKYLQTGNAGIIGSGREVTGRRQDGSKIPLDLSVSEMKLSDRRVFTGIVRDITERKESELALRKTADDLQLRTVDLELARAEMKVVADFVSALNQTSEKKTYRDSLKCVMDHIEIPVCVIYAVQKDGAPACKCAIGVDTGIIHAEQFSGNGLPAEVIGTGEVKKLCGPFRDTELQIHTGIGGLDLHSIIGWPVVFQERCIGTLLTVHIHPLSDRQCAFITACVEQLAIRMNNFQIDQERHELVLDLQKQSRELEWAKEESEKSSRVKSEFLASMSHELRTPMNSIIGFTNRLLKRLNETLSDRDLDALQTVERNAKHLLTLINEILDLSKIEAGKMELDKSSFDIVDIIRDVSIRIAPLADDKPVEIITNLPDESIEIEADRTKVNQIVTNLLSNAIKYTDEGDIKIIVDQVHDESLGQAVRIAIKDTGVGIQEEDQKRLFQAFTQVDKSSKRRSGGTGLGLVIVSRYVDMHGGRLHVQSEYGKGSVFTVYLPLKFSATIHHPTHRPSEKTETKTLTDSQSKESNDSITILCIDEDTEAASYLKNVIIQEGFQVALIKNYEHSLDQLRIQLPDLICLDFQKHNKKTSKWIRTVQNDPLLKNILMVITTKGEIVKTMNNGLRCFLRKPVMGDSVINTMQCIVTGELKKVLIIEDDQDQAKLLTHSLIRSGIDVVIANNGQEGLECVQRMMPDVIIVDFLMPVMNGLEFLDIMHENPIWSRIPVILLTGKHLELEEISRLINTSGRLLTPTRDDAKQIILSLLKDKSTSEKSQEIVRV